MPGLGLDGVTGPFCSDSCKWPTKALPLIAGLCVGGLGADGGTVPLASELLKRAILWPLKALPLIVEAGILWVPEFVVDEDGMCVGGLGPDGGTGPLGSEPCKEATL